MKSAIILSALVATTLLLNSCSTMFGDKNRTVYVTSYPSGAQVLLNGQPVGITPTQVQLASVQGNYIQLQKAGYQSTSTPLDTSFQGVGCLNILFWPGFIVDAATGDMMKLTNANMVVNLQPLHTVTHTATPTPVAKSAS